MEQKKWEKVGEDINPFNIIGMAMTLGHVQNMFGETHYVKDADGNVRSIQVLPGEDTGVALAVGGDRFSDEDDED